MSETAAHTDGPALVAQMRARQPGFREAVAADARVTCAFRGERHEFRSRADLIRQVLRLVWVSDAFAAHVLYRLRTRMAARGIPVLPRIAHRLSMMLAQVSIGDPVLMHPGVYIVHGSIVIDGLTEVHSGTIIAPFVTLGTRAGDFGGPTIGAGVNIGTGAKVIGSVTVGEGAQIGANAVVVDDAPAYTTVVGAPARPVAKE